MSEYAKNGTLYEADPRDCCDRCGGAQRHRAPCAIEAPCHAIMSAGRHWGPDRCVKPAGHDGWHFGERGCAWGDE